jgi:phosphoglucomutase
MELLLQTVRQWPVHYDPSLKESLDTLLYDYEKGVQTEPLTDAFYRDIEFGTGGLRGLLGAGTNRMNRVTVAKAAQGFSNYLCKWYKNSPVSVAIAFDSRHRSEEFARLIADIFSANGIRVYLYGELRPTPALSFAVRRLGCAAGVVITASHNPKEYNGFKAYWRDGGQLVPPHDQAVMAEVRAITDMEQVKSTPNHALISILDQAIDRQFLEEAIKQVPAISPRQCTSVSIVYSPLHGTGITLVPSLLSRLGFEKVHIVEEQKIPDGNFPTVVYPNPEEKEAMTLALSLAESVQADLVLATDPDADRVGIAVRNENGAFELLSGNQTAALLVYFLLESRKKAASKLPEPYIAKTIVTSYLLDEIAKAYDVACINTLTGFKYIAEVIREKEDHATYIAGGEESYGYLIGDFVRDKDAVTACGVLSSLCAMAKQEGKTLFDVLLDIYRKFGLYYESLHSITKTGPSGVADIRHMMQRLRENPPKMLAGSSVVAVLDYEEGISWNPTTNSKEKLVFPKSNVIQIRTEDGTLVSARPSGTEPKIKFYFSVRGTLKEVSEYRKETTMLQEKCKQIAQELTL